MFVVNVLCLQSSMSSLQHATSMDNGSALINRANEKLQVKLANFAN